MELGGVGRAEVCLLVGTGLAVTAAKLSRPAQKLASRGFETGAEVAISARAKAMLEVRL